MTLEGWVPQIGEHLTLDEVVEFAFDYRGNTTIVKTDGAEVVGYVFNRNRAVAAHPHVDATGIHGGIQHARGHYPTGHARSADQIR